MKNSWINIFIGIAIIIGTVIGLAISKPDLQGTITYGFALLAGLLLAIFLQLADIKNRGK